MSGTLYLVPTPIGNLGDMTYRAVEVLRSVRHIACEDTRRTGILCAHYEITTDRLAYHEHNKEQVGPQLLAALAAGEDIALVSDAGMPAVADPGLELVQAVIAANGIVVPLPGANAGLTALIASGLDTRAFRFVGFLPRTRQKQQEALALLRTEPATLIFYEAPHRLAKTLAAVSEALGDRQAVLARELTKKYETFYRGTLRELTASAAAAEPRGEFVILVAGAEPETTAVEQEDWPALVKKYEAEGLRYAEACREVAKAAGVSRREVYAYCLGTDTEGI